MAPWGPNMGTRRFSQIPCSPTPALVCGCSDSSCKHQSLQQAGLTEQEKERKKKGREMEKNDPLLPLPTTAPHLLLQRIFLARLDLQTVVTSEPSKAFHISSSCREGSCKRSYHFDTSKANNVNCTLSWAAFQGPPSMLWLQRAAFFQFIDTGGYISQNLAAAASACLEDYIASELCQCKPQSIGGIK